MGRVYICRPYIYHKESPKCRVDIPYMARRHGGKIPPPENQDGNGKSSPEGVFPFWSSGIFQTAMLVFREV